jgi:hypothetical protein
VECPARSGRLVSLLEVAEELTRRLTGLFRRDAQGRRAVFGSSDKLQNDPQFRDFIPFHEYFEGDTGRGLGASHQTGWTGLIAKLIHPRAARKTGASGKSAARATNPAAEDDPG